MGIQKCATCRNQFTWKEVQKTIAGFWGYRPLICRKCGTKHKVTVLTRILVAFLVPMVVFILNSSNLFPFYIPFYVGLPILLIFFFAMMLSFPYFAQYKSTS